MGVCVCVCVLGFFLTFPNMCYFVYWFIKYEKGHSSFFLENGKLLRRMILSYSAEQRPSSEANRF